MRRRAEERAGAGGPRYPAWLSLPAIAWYIAFGLLVTVIWLYIEILRLLSYFRE